ncbi:MAG: DUF2442 domain-containing protein [Bradyrhizobiaceae bacterium]|nr:DUF2442 domain-containing protein [Hyphomicrobiales bacterium]MBV9429828.1 DUF2442 domain-containing protein [Bradyrhizobiaceae bacterium]
MKQPRIKSVEVVRYPVLLVTYDDGFSGEYDLSHFIGRGPISEPLKDPEYFNHVAIGEYGHTFGWNLDVLGEEIDFCIDSDRKNIEANRTSKKT